MCSASLWLQTLPALPTNTLPPPQIPLGPMLERVSRWQSFPFCHAGMQVKTANVTATGGEELAADIKFSVPPGTTAHLAQALLTEDAAADSASALDQAKDDVG